MHIKAVFAFLDVGTPELLLILFVALLLFGGKKLPELAKGLGKAVKEFKQATSGVEAEIKRAMDEPSSEQKPTAGPTQTTVAPSDSPSEKGSEPTPPQFWKTPAP